MNHKLTHLCLCFVPHPRYFRSLLAHSGARTFPARSFPPDGTTFGQITLGQKLTKEIQPYSYWNMQFYQSEPAYVKFDYTIPRGASIGVYGRRNALPTHTQYHFKEVLSGFSASTRTARAAHVSSTQHRCLLMPQLTNCSHFYVSIQSHSHAPITITGISLANLLAAAFHNARGNPLHGAGSLVRLAVQRRRGCAGVDLLCGHCRGHDAELPERLLWQWTVPARTLPVQSRFRWR